MRRYYSGSDFVRALNIFELAGLAKRRLPHFAWEYLEGGAEDEITIHRNRHAFEQIGFNARTLIPCDTVDTACEIFGKSYPYPVAIGPTGYNGMLWRDADILQAKAAEKMGIPYTMTTVSTSSLEEIRAAAPHVELWFQLYTLKERSIQFDLMKRADAVGCKTLFLTSDAVVLGKREWDKRNFTAPQQLTWRNKVDVVCHPHWMWQALWPNGVPTLGNLNPYLPEGHKTAAGAAHFMGHQMDRTLDWQALADLRERWPHRLILKGVQSAADAERCIAMGIDGVVVSNHGGRQLDGAPASIELLPAIAAVASGKITVFLDSGIRRGSDIVKARALGADMILIGRAGLYGLAVGGELGVRHALQILTDELKLTMALIGRPSLSDLHSSCVRILS